MYHYKSNDKHNIVALLEVTKENADFRDSIAWLRSKLFAYAISHEVKVYNDQIREFWFEAKVVRSNNTIRIKSTVQGKKFSIDADDVKRVLQLDNDAGKEKDDLSNDDLINEFESKLRFEGRAPWVGKKKEIKKTFLSKEWILMCWFLNKACIALKPEDMNQQSVTKVPWSICTVDQVEELKTLIKVIPLWSSSIMLHVAMNQTTFPVLQAQTMDRHITAKFEIPPASFGFFVVITVMVWVVLYDRVILPTLSKIKGKPVYISAKLRIGAGLCFSIAGMVVSGVVEHVRKGKAIEAGLLNDPRSVITMSALWLIPQNVLNGLAEALNIIGQNEFYYSEFPKSMSSIGTALYILGLAFASLFASLLLSTVEGLTKGKGKDSWISTNINTGHYDKYYWLLAIMSCINFLYHVVMV